MPESALDNFDLDLFCLQPGKFEFDIDNDTPAATLEGNIEASGEDGIVFRTGPMLTFFKWSSSKSGHVPSGYYYGTDTEDGSSQGINLLCTDGLCDIYLSDFRCSTCQTLLTNITFFAGIGVARGISEDSLDDT